MYISFIYHLHIYIYIHLYSVRAFAASECDWWRNRLFLPLRAVGLSFFQVLWSVHCLWNATCGWCADLSHSVNVVFIPQGLILVWFFYKLQRNGFQGRAGRPGPFTKIPQERSRKLLERSESENNLGARELVPSWALVKRVFAGLNSLRLRHLSSARHRSSTIRKRMWRLGWFSWILEWMTIFRTFSQTFLPPSNFRVIVFTLHVIACTCTWVHVSSMINNTLLHTTHYILY